MFVFEERLNWTAASTAAQSQKNVVMQNGKAMLISNPKDQLGVTIVLGARIIQPFLPPCRTFLIERTGCRAGQRVLSANSVLPGPYCFALLIMSIGLAVVGIALSLSQGTGIPEVEVSA